MKPPVNLESLMEEWSKDCVVDETEPSREMAKIPRLHSKYLNILTHHKLVAKKLKNDYDKLRKIKLDYYSGDLNDPEDLEKYGFTEPMMKKIYKPDMSSWLDSDADLNKILLKKIVHDEVVSYCESVLKELHSRTFQIKSFMEWERYIGNS